MVLGLILSACNDESGAGGNDKSPNQQALDDNRNLWQVHGLATYQFTVRRLCFCPIREDIVVMVLNHTVDAAFYTPSGVILNDIELEQLHTIDGYFDVIQDAIDRNVDELTVQYDGVLNYPTQIAIDVHRAVADDEVTYHLMDLQ